METTASEQRKPHHGMNVKRLREHLQIKQEYLAVQMGLSQQAISNIEQRETIDAPTMEKISAILKVPVELIKNYDEEKTIMNIQHNYEGANPSANNVFLGQNYSCTFNPLDKLMEVVDENKKLYERLLESEKEKNELLQKSLHEKNK